MNIPLAPIPENEENRLTALIRYNILDTPEEEVFEDLAEFASEQIGVPIAYIAFMDTDRMWMKACFGADTNEVDRKISFCAHTILDQHELIVEDTLEDARFRENPFVINDPKLRFYAGVPITTRDGYNIGTFCVADVTPRSLSETEKRLLRILADTVYEKLALRKSQSAVKESELLFTNLFHDSNDAQLLFDSSFNVIEMNEAAKLLFEFKERPNANYSILNLLPEPIRASEKDRFETLLDDGHFSITLNLLRTNHSLFPAKVLGNTIILHAARIGHLSIEDLSDTRAINLELRESKALFQGVQSLANIGSWAFYPKTGRIVWSDEVYRITGFAHEQSPPNFEEYLSCIHLDDRQEFLDAVKNTIETGEFYQIEHRITTRDGIEKRVISQGQGFSSETGEVEKLFGSIQDVTEQYNAREKMLESQQRLRFHLMQSPMGYIEWDLNFNIVEWNPACERIFGFKKEEILGTLPPIVPQELVDEVSKLFKKLITGDGGTHSINENLTADGSRITCEWANTSLRSSTGQIVAISSIVQDITERKKALEDLKKYATELELAKTAAEQADKAKSTFLANMSHEIRTPMNGVIGMTSLLQETALDTEQLEYVNTIRKSGESLLSVINDILDFSKIEANKIDLEFRPFDVHSCAEEAIELVGPRAAAKKLPILYLPDPALPNRIVTDSVRLRQVLVNLLSNAIKFTEKGYVALKITSSDIASSGTEVQFSIVDTGMGIPADKREKLFKAFSQVDASTTRKHGGTGLGLRISARLVELMGGKIWVESQENEGSTFHFTIVCESNQFPEFNQKKLLYSKRLLIAEVDKGAYGYSKEILEQHGLEVETVSTQSELRERLSEGTSFDAILMDDDFAPGQLRSVIEELAPWTQDTPLVLKHWLNVRYPFPEIAASLSKPLKRSILNECLAQLFADRNARRFTNGPASTALRSCILSTSRVQLALLQRLLNSMNIEAASVETPEELLDQLEAHPTNFILLQEKNPEREEELLDKIYSSIDPEQRPWIVRLSPDVEAPVQVASSKEGIDFIMKDPATQQAIEHLLAYSATNHDLTSA